MVFIGAFAIVSPLGPGKCRRYFYPGSVTLPCGLQLLRLNVGKIGVGDVLHNFHKINSIFSMVVPINREAFCFHPVLSLLLMMVD